ncbi:MAG: hypothetical protein NTW87_16585 [Planctomycetota bacterium]|nr:hypothetical protein [Planctomycetota bacterium]
MKTDSPASRGCGEDEHALQYKVGFLGIPDSTKGEMRVPVPWNAENLGRLKALGFNAIQLNVAWGPRPADEPLNIEDVVELPPDQERRLPQSVPLRCDPSPQRRRQRKADLRERLDLCRQAGLRTIFHFGAPYNAHCRYGDGPPNCISDPKVAERYVLLLDRFADEFTDVDDILVYTYDQDAWLCSEFGPCPRCLGVPLHERLTPFLNELAKAWWRHSPQGRLWWEPWELSAGQVLRCVERLQPEGLGLALHSNIAEVMATHPVDRWFKNTCGLALRWGIPVVAECFLGASSEELEPFLNLAHPLVTLRALKALTAVPGVVGIKEYYGLAPDREDPNLRMAGLFFANPRITEDEALRDLARPYGKAVGKMTAFWRLAGEAMELFPWETSWFVREVGRSRPDHSLAAAFLRGQQCHTPSWFSTRHAIFMKTDDAQPDPWMLEDVQLRCELAAERMGEALEAATEARGAVPAEFSERLAANMADLGRFRRRALAYAYHLRETNLATVMRVARKAGQKLPDRVTAELLAAMQADLDNYRADQPSPAPTLLAWQDMEEAIALLRRSPDEFLEDYFTEKARPPSKGVFSVTSR